MKETYERPDIMFEDFSLSSNIAGDCESIVGSPSKGTCAMVGSGDIAVFTSEINACDFTPEGEDEAADQWDGFCYHVPTEYNNLFNS